MGLVRRLAQCRMLSLRVGDEPAVVRRRNTNMAAPNSSDHEPARAAAPNAPDARPTAPDALPLDDAPAVWPARSLRSRARGAFLVRQFEPPATHPQWAFDFAFGILTPIVCLTFDPIVFRSTIGGGPVFERYALPAYLLTGIAMVALAVSWTPLVRCALAAAMLAGAFAGGALFALGLGLFLLPLATVGLALAGLGALGYTPLLTAFTYTRGAFRLWRRHNRATNVPLGRALALLAGLGLVLGLPAGLHVTRYGVVRLAIRDLKRGDPSDAERAAARLARWPGVLPLDRIAREAVRTPDAAARARLAAAYERASGQSVDAWVDAQSD